MVVRLTFYPFCPDIMLQMGYSAEEIQDSLVNQKYNEVMATYLLLDYRNTEVQSVYTHICRSELCPTPAMVILMTIPPLLPQMDECISLSMKSRPGSDLTNSNAQSPSHKVQRSTSSNLKPRRATEAGRKLFGLTRVL